MKQVRGKTYLHKSIILTLENGLKSKITKAIYFLPSNREWNIVRLDASDKIAFLYYPKFYPDPHPSLKHSILIDGILGQAKVRLASLDNPPILHRKETFIAQNDPNYKKFQNLTTQEEKAGLLDHAISHKIGFKKQWEELLKTKGLKIINHELISAN